MKISNKCSDFLWTSGEPPVNRINLWALTLMGPQWHKTVLYSLAVQRYPVQLFENWLFMYGPYGNFVWKFHTVRIWTTGMDAEIVETTFRFRFRFRFLKYPLFKKVVFLGTQNKKVVSFCFWVKDPKRSLFFMHKLSKVERGKGLYGLERIKRINKPISY